MWPIKGFCKDGVQDRCKEVNLQLYVDASGDVFRAYGARADTSTVVVIDSKARVRYVKSGKIADEDIPKLITLVSTLTQQTDSPSPQPSPTSGEGAVFSPPLMGSD
jgi:predicted transcriptional regulator